MSTSWTLYRLYSLDPSSLDFSCHLHSFTWRGEVEQYLKNLQGPELDRLVDFLDKVRALPSTFCLATKWILQTLDVISADENLSRKCLHKLQAICGHHAILPSSYIASSKIAKAGDAPIILGAIADVWEGTYSNKKVLINCLRAPLNDDQTLKKVRSQGVRS